MNEDEIIFGDLYVIGWVLGVVYVWVFIIDIVEMKVFKCIGFDGYGVFVDIFKFDIDF